MKEFQAFGADELPPKDTAGLLARMEADFKAAYPLERYGYLPYYMDPKMPIYADGEGRLRVKAGRVFGEDGGFGGYTDCADRAWLLAIRLMNAYGKQVDDIGVHGATVEHTYGRRKEMELSHWMLSTRLGAQGPESKDAKYPIFDATPINRTFRLTHPPLEGAESTVTIGEPIFIPVKDIERIRRAMKARADPFVDGYLPLEARRLTDDRYLLAEGGIIESGGDSVVYGLNVSEFVQGMDPLKDRPREARFAGDAYNFEVRVKKADLARVKDELGKGKPEEMLKSLRALKGVAVDETASVEGKGTGKGSLKKTTIDEMEKVLPVIRHLILKTPEGLR